MLSPRAINLLLLIITSTSEVHSLTSNNAATAMASSSSDSNKSATTTDDTLRQIFPDTKSVKIFPDDFLDDPHNVVDADLIDRYRGHFSDRRVAILIRPGVYENVNLPVGYWTQVLGLGATPEQVSFVGQLGVYALPSNTDNPGVGSLDTFWRAAENFVSDTNFVKSPNGTWAVPVIDDSLDVDDKVQASLAPADGVFPKLYDMPNASEVGLDDDKTFEPSKGMLWAVSQAAPLRRVHVKNNLHLSLGDNYASGGFLGNVQVDNNLLFGTQQQFCVRGSSIGSQAIGGAWSIVFHGCKSQEGKASKDPVPWVGTKPQVVWEAQTPQRVEKPFIFLDDDGRLFLGVPQLQTNAQGVDHQPVLQKYEITPSGMAARVVSPEDEFADIQAAADKGIHLILSPGTYEWKETLHIRNSNQVVLGLGMATIQAPGTGAPCIKVHPQAVGVRLSGLSLEASVISKFIYDGSTLLQWGDPEQIGAGDSAQPGVIHDLYCFVGGRSLDRTVKVQTMVKIYSSHVIGDNLWLWRADHVKLMPKEAPNRPELSEYHITTYGECMCDTGLEVYGDHVVFYGLAVEHTYKDMVSWYGKQGRVYFYQSEMPYDVSGDVYQNVAGYRVHVGADYHVAKGVGVYSYFRDYGDVEVDSAVVNHSVMGSVFEKVFTVWLNGYSGIRSVINGLGGPTGQPGIPIEYSEYKGEHLLSPHFWKGIPKKLFSKP